MTTEVAMCELTPEEREAMLFRIDDWACGGDPSEPFDFIAWAEDVEAHLASGAVLDPACYEPNDPAFWAALARECRAIPAG
jgi:hypothetical protein